MIKKLTEHIPIIIKKVEVLQKEKKQAVERKNEFRAKYVEQLQKKKKYKAKCKRFLKEEEEEDDIVHNAEE